MKIQNIYSFTMNFFQRICVITGKRLYSEGGFELHVVWNFT